MILEKKKLPSPGEMTELNGNDSRQYFLAQVIKTSLEDDSLAINYSILRDSHQREFMERSWAKYILAWPLMMVLSIYVMLKDILYWLIIRPTDKERKLLGPEGGTLWFDVVHPLGHTVRNGVTTSAALDVIYSIDLAISQPRTVGEKLVRFWLDQPDGQAVRNRLRLTYKAIRSELEQLYSAGNKEIKFLSLACGSAQATIDAVADFIERYPNAELNVTLVDLNLSALRRAVRLADSRGIAGRVRVVVKHLKDFLAEQPSDSWDLIEMVGFLDYRPEKSVVRDCGQIRRILRPGGLFVGAHICPNPWSFVVRWVINWPLLRRRKPEKYRQLLLASFLLQEIERFECEPNRIYVVSSCRKFNGTA